MSYALADAGVGNSSELRAFAGELAEVVADRFEDPFTSRHIDLFPELESVAGGEAGSR